MFLFWSHDCFGRSSLAKGSDVIQNGGDVPLCTGRSSLNVTKSLSMHFSVYMHVMSPSSGRWCYHSSPLGFHGTSSRFRRHHCTGADPGFGQGGPQPLRPKVANVAKRSCASEASILRPGSMALLRALEAFGFLMLKYAFSHILETLFLLFLTSILTPKVDKNRALDFTSINLRHSDMLHLFFNLHEKVML